MSTNRNDYLFRLLAGLPSAKEPLNLFSLATLASPREPVKWTQNYLKDVSERTNKRISVLQDRIAGVTTGRVMPDLEQVTIGSGKQYSLAVLFLDICSFSSRPNWLPEEQKHVLATMNIFMAEMINIARDFNGTFEKNTGDGLMAYFGADATSDAERVTLAVEAAVVMHYVNDCILSSRLQQLGLHPVTFRVGIDVGPVTIGRVGIRGDENSFVAIGTTANLACKLMNLIPAGGICIGQNTYKELPMGWASKCVACAEETGFIYVADKSPYPAWVLNHRLTTPGV